MSHGISINIDANGTTVVHVSVTHVCGHSDVEYFSFTHAGLECLHNSEKQPCFNCAMKQINHNRSREMSNLSQPDAWDN